MAEQRISYNDIKESCDKLTDNAKSLKECTDTMNTALSKIKESWKGTAADAFVEKFTPLANKMEDATRLLAESVLFLASCADGYEALGEQAKGELMDLVGEDYINNFDVEGSPDIDLTKPTYLNLEQEANSETDESNPDASTTVSQNTSSNSGDGAYSGGGLYGSYSNGGSYGGNSSVTPIAPIAPITPIKPSDSDTQADEEDKTTLKSGETAEIPNTLNQSQYQTSQYNNNQFDENSKEKELEDIWKNQGSNNHNGIATVSISNENRYLVKVAPKYGNVGDSIDITLEDGSVVKGVIAENQATDNSTTVYGASQENGRINVVEFEAASEESVKYDWNSSSAVTKIKNNGNVLTNSSVPTKVAEGKAYPPNTVSIETNNSTQNVTTETTQSETIQTENVATETAPTETVTSESTEG